MEDKACLNVDPTQMSSTVPASATVPASTVPACSRDVRELHRGVLFHGPMEVGSHIVPCVRIGSTPPITVPASSGDSEGQEAAAEGAHDSGRIAVRVDEVRRAPPVVMDMIAVDSDTESAFSSPRSQAVSNSRGEDDASVHEGEESDIRHVSWQEAMNQRFLRLKFHWQSLMHTFLQPSERHSGGWMVAMLNASFSDGRL